MINSKELFLEFQNKLVVHESINESESTSYIVLETIFGLSRTDILLRKEIEITREKEALLSETVKATLSKKSSSVFTAEILPVQGVKNEGSR